MWFVLAAIAAIGLVFDLADFTERITSPFYALVLFIAFVVFVSVGVGQLFMANAALQAERDHLKDASPSIRFEKVGGPSEVSLGPIGHVDRKLEIWQRWFVNEPHIWGAMAVAKELRAETEPCDSDWNVTGPRLWECGRLPKCLITSVGAAATMSVRIWRISRKPLILTASPPAPSTSSPASPEPTASQPIVAAKPPAPASAGQRVGDSTPHSRTTSWAFALDRAAGTWRISNVTAR